MTRILTTREEARSVLSEFAQRPGLVPTMGALHAGHEALIEQSARENAQTVVSVFVNPTQFGNTQDLARYPRDLDADIALATSAGATHLFVPEVDEMYGVSFDTWVEVPSLSKLWEGDSRPGHFRGVCTVVSILLNLVQPSRSYFGEKDFQQLAVIRKMVVDLSLPVEVVGCPTVREADGLAMSSRNVNLRPDERAAAPVLHRALLAGRDAIERGERDPAAVRAAMYEVVAGEPLARLDYAAVVDAATFEVPDPIVGELRLLIAVRFANARLIDNVGARVPTPARD
jgi:pantoate--beta-alanine ligase